MKNENRTKKSLFDKRPRRFKHLILDEACRCGGNLYRLYDGNRCLVEAKCDNCGLFTLVSDCLHGGPPEGTHDTPQA